MPSGDSQRGHRKRLREKFLKSGLVGFHDYEIVELLLSLGTPRKDCKLPAKEALERFRTLRGVMEASPEDLQEIEKLKINLKFDLVLNHLSVGSPQFHDLLLRGDLGRVKTVATIPAISTHLLQGEECRDMACIPADLIRLSVGGEHPDDIIGDLDQALQK